MPFGARRQNHSKRKGHLMQVREQGIIKKFVQGKGYGFLARKGCPDLFFHVTEFEPGAGEFIHPGMRVEFEVQMDGRTGRLKAALVELLAGDAV